MKSFTLHTTTWLFVLLFWIFVSRNNHPTLLLNFIASTTLVIVSAVAAYAFFLRFLPKLRSSHNRIRRFFEFTATILALDLSAVLLIQYAYDTLWGPDPARFGFWTNVLLEAAFIGIHVIVFSLIVFTIRNRRRATA